MYTKPKKKCKCDNADKIYFKMLNLILKHPITHKILLTHVRSVFKTSFFKPNKLLQNILTRHRKLSNVEVNLNVQNNVILYKFIKNNYYRNVQIFAVGQLLGWWALAYNMYNPTFWNVFTTDLTLKEYLANNAFQTGILTFALLAGPIMFLFIYTLSARSVKYVILNKGGKTVSFVTYHMQKKKSSFTLPIEMVNTKIDRRSAAGFISIKIQNKSFYYLLDNDGTFVNPELFDHVTA